MQCEQNKKIPKCKEQAQQRTASKERSKKRQESNTNKKAMNAETPSPNSSLSTPELRPQR
jgi:hypothetical protein